MANVFDKDLENLFNRKYQKMFDDLSSAPEQGFYEVKEYKMPSEILERLGKAINEEFPDLDLKIEDAKINVKEHEDNKPPSYRLSFRLELTTSDLRNFQKKIQGRRVMIIEPSPEK